MPLPNSKRFRDTELGALDHAAGPDAVFEMRVQSEAQFFAAIASSLRAKAPGAPSVGFESLEALLALLTPKRRGIIAALRARESFPSIEALAQELGRDRVSVSRDVKALREAGVITRSHASSPGHGRRSELRLRARAIQVSFTL